MSRRGRAWPCSRTDRLTSHRCDGWNFPPTLSGGPLWHTRVFRRSLRPALPLIPLAKDSFRGSLLQGPGWIILGSNRLGRCRNDGFRGTQYLPMGRWLQQPLPVCLLCIFGLPTPCPIHRTPGTDALLGRGSIPHARGRRGSFHGRQLSSFHARHTELMYGFHLLHSEFPPASNDRRTQILPRCDSAPWWRKLHAGLSVAPLHPFSSVSPHSDIARGAWSAIWEQRPRHGFHFPTRFYRLRMGLGAIAGVCLAAPALLRSRPFAPISRCAGVGPRNRRASRPMSSHCYAPTHARFSSLSREIDGDVSEMSRMEAENAERG